MNPAERVLHAADRLQQRRPWLAFPIAVWKKFGDDQAGNLAALIAYYGFAALFPLLLVFVTVLDIVLRDNATLRQNLLDSAFGQFPVIGDQLKHNVHSLQQTGPALVIGLLLTFLGARGVAGAVQNALNTVWGVSFARRPGFPWALLRSVTLIVVVGTGVLLTSFLSGLAGGSGHILTGVGAYLGAIAVSLLLNIGLFWLGFRLATASEVSWRDQFPGALLAAIAWQVLQLLGGYLVAHQLAKSSSLYGVFGLVLGLLAWLYLQAQFTLYAVEVAVVRARRLWPRSLAPPPLTEEDRLAYQMYAEAQKRRPDQEIESNLPDAEPAHPDPDPDPRPRHPAT
jgi:membrane protein